MNDPHGIDPSRHLEDVGTPSRPAPDLGPILGPASASGRDDRYPLAVVVPIQADGRRVYWGLPLITRRIQADNPEVRMWAHFVTGTSGPGHEPCQPWEIHDMTNRLAGALLALCYGLDPADALTVVCRGSIGAAVNPFHVAARDLALFALRSGEMTPTLNDPIAAYGPRGRELWPFI